MNLEEQRHKIDEFIKRGENILVKECHIPGPGIIMPEYIAGPLFDTWMGEINIFNKRYLKNHPLQNSIHSTYFDYKNSYSSCEEMLGHLRALATDDEFFGNTQINSSDPNPVKSIADLLSEDISRCQQYLSSNKNENIGRALYSEITGRYDNLIKNFGQGLYSYLPEQHFYDPDISIDTVNYNLNILLQKMISYQSINYGRQESQKEGSQETLSNKVFLVHGHDDGATQTMARTLEKAGLEVVILREQASGSSTIIEKIEKYSDVAFAVVLYTPCDLGRAKDEAIENERPRARQNVVFEHGYLISKLGRKKVCALVKGRVETPGDISGVVYIEMDIPGAWKALLCKEMQAAGISTDMNKFCS